MSSFIKLASVFAFCLSLSATGRARAAEFKEEISGVTLHVSDEWKKSDDKSEKKTMKLTLEKGEPGQTDRYCALKLGHVVVDADTTLEEFKAGLIKSFPADWTALKTANVTVGKEKIPALRIPYRFQTSGITFRLELYLFKRGNQFTFFQLVATQKAMGTMRKEIAEIVTDADINPAGGEVSPHFRLSSKILPLAA